MNRGNKVITPETWLAVLYEVERKIMKRLPLKGCRDEEISWQVLQEMIEDEYKRRDALARMGNGR